MNMVDEKQACINEINRLRKLHREKWYTGAYHYNVNDTLYLVMYKGYNTWLQVLRLYVYTSPLDRELIFQTDNCSGQSVAAFTAWLNDTLPGA